MKEGEEHFEGKVAQKAIIVSPQGKVLICRNNWDKDTWDLPGGMFNVQEKPEAGLLREIKEEIGIEPTHIKPFVISTFIKRKTGKFTFVIIYTAHLSEENSYKFEDGEIEEIRWIEHKDLPTLTFFPEYAEALEKFFSER